MIPLDKMKCQSKDRNSKSCRNFAIVNYCKIHSYMEEYTDEMKANVKLCSACKLWSFMGEYNTCEGCRLRGSAIRDKVKETIVLCVKEGCKYKKSDNKYCGKHQADYFLEQTKEAGLKQCYNYLRGCRTQNDPSYRFSKCAICLEKDRDKDKKKRKEVVTDEGRKCNTCFKFYPFIHFKGIHGDTLTCSMCRESNKRADEKRDKEHIQELARTNAKKPERIAVKKAWKERNHDKCSAYWIESCARLIEANIEVYLMKNAEKSKKWREANPEKVKIINKESSENIEYHYKNYVISASLRNLEFTLTKEYFMDIVKTPCDYCNIIQKKGFNGIDRLDSTIGYTVDNCKSCCEMCNMMKGTTGHNIFIQRVGHILTYLNLIEGSLFPDAFANISHINYSKYKCSAIKRNIEFTIDKEYFDTETKKSCYLCGKNPNENHKNGLDRFDNDKGYNEDNVKSCCANCNYLKRNYIYNDFIDKLMCIYKSNKDKNYQDTTNEEKCNTVKGNKKSKEEINEISKLRKEKKRDDLRNKYSDEEYKKMRIKNIVENKKKIK